MSKEEYKNRFIKRFISLGIDKEVGLDEWEAWEPDFYDSKCEDPEGSADECLSYWEE